jgi:hypothetical protein
MLVMLRSYFLADHSLSSALQLRKAVRTDILRPGDASHVVSSHDALPADDPPFCRATQHVISIRDSAALELVPLRA